MVSYLLILIWWINTNWIWITTYFYQNWRAYSIFQFTFFPSIGMNRNDSRFWCIKTKSIDFSLIDSFISICIQNFQSWSNVILIYWFWLAMFKQYLIVHREAQVRNVTHIITCLYVSYVSSRSDNIISNILGIWSFYPLRTVCGNDDIMNYVWVKLIGLVKY